MPVIEFHNRNETPLILVVEPCGERCEIPHLATAGVRYLPEDGAEDRSSCVVSDGQIEFWCNTDTCDIDVVHPSAFEKLSWDICVNGGWCGGIVDGKPTRVEDLLPESGLVTARHFAELAIRADGWPVSSPLPENHLLWLETKFVEHLGAQSALAEDFRQDPAIPFGHSRA
jgi:hypothetical protein